MPPRPRRVHIALLLATVITTLLAGARHFAFFEAGFNAAEVVNPWTFHFLLRGTAYTVAILGILGAHEMGHYLTCRYYGVDATLPFFLPGPPPLLTGTLGAVIRIRSAFPSKAILFDIAVAGPIAGFLVLVPLLFLGLSLSPVVRLPPDFVGVWLGEPPLFRFATWALWGSIPDGYSVNLHPIAFAAWFGLFATALNLLPFAQLDGGHVAYAALGRRATAISLATVCTAVALTVYSMSWMFVTALMIVALFVAGPRHPPVIDESAPLDRARQIVAVLMIVMFVLCFTPSLIEFTDLLPQ